MGIKSWVIWLKRTNRYFPFIIFTFFLLLNSSPSYSIDVLETSSGLHDLNSALVLTKSFFNIMLTLIGVLIIICTTIVFLSIKLKRVNRELQERNKQILDINISLQRSNSDLANQKELITKEHSESEKFYGMLVQSARDGISFYDREWNLKFANSAFYSIIGYDMNTYDQIDFNDIIHPEDHDFQLKKIQALVNNGFYESEIRLKHKEGHYINMSTRSVTVRNDNGSSWFTYYFARYFKIEKG